MPYFGPHFWSSRYFGASFWTVGGVAVPTTLASALAAALKANPVLAALVGARVYPVVRPESSAVPCIYYRIVSRDRMHTLDGGSGGAGPRVQFGLCSLRYGDLARMQDAIRTILDGFAGPLGTVQVTSAYAEDAVDQTEDYGDGSGRMLFHRACDYFIYHRETIPEPAEFPGTEEDLEAALVATVKADATIAALAGGRVFPGMIPEGTARPALWFALLKASGDTTLDGATGCAVDQWRWGIQARSYSDVEALAELLRQRFQGFSGLLGAVDFTSSIAHDEADAWIDPKDGSSDIFYERTADFEFQHRESVPTF